ncbi:TetR/AcrR family transcriptional regulator [Streptomyces sp. SID14478]|uniref:TetR/AcrR family transcriptional regulator n=1 Tax=Streptomyces sp. SID14478 TaxID=2706073 RepID=UPI0031BAEDB8
MAKQARALQTHSRALDAAAYEVARYGYANTNLQRIADQIGLTKGALYGHFSSKEELAAALTGHLLHGVTALLDKARTPPGDAHDRLAALVLGLGDLFSTNLRAQAALRLEVDAARAAEKTAPVLDDIHRVTLRLVNEVQRAGQWDATLPSAPLADLIVAVPVTVSLASTEPGREQPSRSDVRAMWGVLTRALSTPSAG